MFVRFVVGGQAENAFRLAGPFMAAYKLTDRGELQSYESEWLEEVLAWFNTHLPVPPFDQRRRAGRWSPAAVCWFRPDAGEPLQRMWDLVAFLEEHARPVRILTTHKPGKVVYEDAYQVVAVTPKWY